MRCIAISLTWIYSIPSDQLQTLDDDDRRHNKLDPSPYVPSPTPPLGHCYTAIIIRLQCLNSQDHKVGTTYNVCIVVTLPLAPDSSEHAQL